MSSVESVEAVELPLRSGPGVPVGVAPPARPNLNSAGSSTSMLTDLEQIQAPLLEGVGFIYGRNNRDELPKDYLELSTGKWRVHRTPNSREKSHYEQYESSSSRIQSWNLEEA